MRVPGLLSDDLADFPVLLHVLPELSVLVNLLPNVSTTPFTPSHRASTNHWMWFAVHRHVAFLRAGQYLNIQSPISADFLSVLKCKNFCVLSFLDQFPFFDLCATLAG